MACVLLTWELGGGLGHLVNLRPIVKGLRERQHVVYVALRDLSRAENVLGIEGIHYLQAPLRVNSSLKAISPTRSFAHLLHNNGFGAPKELRAISEAWRSIFFLVRPDLIVFDHSPTALLAAKTIAARRALIGTGFFCPCDSYPMPNLRASPTPSVASLCRDEDAVLQDVNRLLNAWSIRPLERLSQLYSDVNEHFLVSFAELDHYGHREGQRYWGAWPNVGGTPPAWPQKPGPRIFAYLKPFAALRNTLSLLRDLGHPTIVYVDKIPAATQRAYASPTLRFENQRLDLEMVGKECDLAILNGDHGTTVSMLLAGKPTLQIPLFLEQGLFSRAVSRLGAGLVAAANRPEQIAVQLITMLTNAKFTESAKRFANRYVDFDPDGAVRDVVERCHELASAHGAEAYGEELD